VKVFILGYMRTTVVYFKKDLKKAEKIAKKLNAEMIEYYPEVFKDSFGRYDVIVAIMACGIVVRKIAPLLTSKWKDSAVVVVDKELKYAIPILGGHKGGNAVAERLQEIGIQPVITTEAEVSRGLCVGIGSRKGVSAEEVESAIREALKLVGAELEQVRLFATASIKKKERGIIEAVDKHKKPLLFLEPEQINSMDIRPSKAEIVGLRSVAEASALYYARDKKLLLPKRVFGRVTIAIAR